MKILIGTTNEAKIKGAERAFKHYFNDFEIMGIKVDSNVRDEPVDLDIYNGAQNRVNNLIKYAFDNNIDADYYLGIESGITNLLGKWIIINVAVITDKNGFTSWGTSEGFPVPNRYVDEIINKDLGTVMDNLFNEHDLRSKKGGINFLTNNVINRIDITESAFIMALTMHINEYWKE